MKQRQLVNKDKIEGGNCFYIRVVLSVKPRLIVLSPQIWKVEKEKGRENKKVGDRLSYAREAQRELKTTRELEER